MRRGDIVLVELPHRWALREGSNLAIGRLLFFRIPPQLLVQRHSLSFPLPPTPGPRNFRALLRSAQQPPMAFR